MKLNIPRTVLVGFAFFTILAFLQLYNMTIPLILKETFDLNEVAAGAIMAADNVLALFMLPLFGMLSDKTNTKIGKRMPYILVGTIVTVLMLMLLAFFDTPSTLTQFIVVLGLLLIATSIYRSPAVALMPDVTPKPLLSKGNAVINLMGVIGGILTLGLILLLSPDDGERYYILFGSVAILMVIGIGILYFNSNEEKWRKEKEEISPVEPIIEKSPTAKAKPMSKAKRNSLLFLLASTFLWFFSYNAIVSAYSKFAVFQWGLTDSKTSFTLMVPQIIALLSFIPIGIIATKIGRKKTILYGIAMLTLGFGGVGFFTEYNDAVMLLLIVAGIGWSAITVNSYPMVVSLGKGEDIGKYTGYYYSASMASQIATPILSGILLEYVGYWTLFPYAAFFAALSASTFIFVKYGDSKPAKIKNKLEVFDVDI